MRRGIFKLAACAVFLMGVSAWAATDTEPKGATKQTAACAKDQDALLAAPDNHRVLDVDADTGARMIKVVVKANSEEPYHCHPYNSVLCIVDVSVPVMDRAAGGKSVKVHYLSMLPEVPCFTQHGQELHSIKNLDKTRDAVLYRLDFPHGFPGGHLPPPFAAMMVQDPH